MEYVIKMRGMKTEEFKMTVYAKFFIESSQQNKLKWYNFWV